MSTLTAAVEKPVPGRKPAAAANTFTAATLQRKCACGGTAANSDSECQQCKKKKLQRRASDFGEVNAAPPIVDEVLESPGQPLDAATRSFMEPRFGHDFSKVRVHTDHRAAESARAVNSLAYTVGRSVVFGAGQYAPGKVAGRKLLAHELTHVVQQRAMRNPAPQAKLEVGPANDSQEQEADRFADQVVGVSDTASAPPPNPRGGQPARVQRAVDDQAPSATATAPPVASPIVDDEAQQLGPGQMRKTEFLDKLRTHICSVADSVLVSVGRTAQGCPVIERWIGHLRQRNVQYIERGIRKYAARGPQASAQDYITAVGERVRDGVTRWAATGDISGVPPELMSEMAGGGFLGALAGMVSGIGGAIGGVVSGIGKLFTKARDGGAREGNPVAIQAQLNTATSARPLEGGVQARMESAFGYDFSRVRIHADHQAAQLSSSLNARAFTVGNDVAFAAGEYRPGSLVGDALIAHELAHVIQQGNGQAGPMAKGDSQSSSLEEDADLSAIGAMVSLWRGARTGLKDISRQAVPRLRSGLRLQRCYGPSLVQKGTAAHAGSGGTGSGAFSVEARIGDVVEVMERQEGMVGLEYKGPEAKHVRFIQFFWCEMLGSPVPPNGDAHLIVAFRPQGGAVLVNATNPTQPEWFVDVSRTSKDPFYDTGPPLTATTEKFSIRTSETNTMFDKPSGATDDVLSFAFKKYPSVNSIVTIFHFDTYVVRPVASKTKADAYEPLYHVSWEAQNESTKQAQGLNTGGPSYKVTGGGAVKGLPPILQLPLVGPYSGVEIK